MHVPIFEWPVASSFLDRESELARLEAWWTSQERMPINLYGRRRAGKSWLCRRFAHGKPALLLVAQQVAPGSQLSTFAAKLAPILGVVPSLPDIATLFRVLFRAARDQKLLVVIDEFPWMLPTTDASIEQELSAVQAVFEEERDQSQLKLVLCGSMVAQMEALMGVRSPMHGRLVPLQLQPMRFRDASLFFPRQAPLAQFERFALAGGMPRYLSALSDPRGSLRSIVCDQMLDRNAPLWDEGRTVLEQELREPKVYFSILQSLSTGDKELNEIVQALRSSPSSVSKYLNTLEEMRIVTRRLPVGAAPSSRAGHWHLRDAFFRFWFRFVFPYQDELESGLKASDLFDAEVAPALNDHVAVEFEDWCRDWTRSTHGHDATKVGAWWGQARHDLRRTGVRSSEEIDIVGLGRGRVSVVGEAKWQRRRLDVGVLRDLEEFKIPALEQAGFRLSTTLRILLFAKAGYTDGLVDAAKRDDRIVLVDVPTALGAAASPSTA